MMKKILLLGSGGLGREFVVSAQRKGRHIIVCGSYAGVPAMQVANEFEVSDMLNGEEPERAVKKHYSDIIVLETKAIHTERLYDFEKGGIQVAPSAYAVNFTMNRKVIHDLVAQELGLKTAKHFYTKTPEELKEAADKIGFPCVIKPLMPSPGKEQSLVKSTGELEHAWEYGCSSNCGDIHELITEEFIKFDGEVTLLTVTQKNGSTFSCPLIGHVQKGGNYRENFQPAHTDPVHLREAEEIAEKVTRVLTGVGLWGVEFFLSHDNGVYSSELSPRPYDTGMVTLAGIQNLNEFELHLRAVLGLPIPGIKQERIDASAMILPSIVSQERPQYRRLEEVTEEEDTCLRIFGKPFTRVSRRMGVILCYAPFDSDSDVLRNKAERTAEKVEVH